MSLRRQLTAFRGFGLWSPRRLSRWLAVGCLTAGCGSDLVLPGNEPVLAIRVVDGDGQQGSVGEPLTAPVVVEVTDGEGAPVEDATVQFALTAAGEGGEVTPSTARTDGDGRAQAFVLLGDKVGVQTGEARVTGDGEALPTATFSAMAVTADTPPPPPPSNEAPEAEFEFTCLGLSCTFSDRSRDDDGNVVSWLWEFGDGTTSSSRNPSHTFGAAGRYEVRLRVTDDDGATDTRTRTVEVQAPPTSNKPPDADFEVHCSGLTCSFTDKSKDDDGFIVSWRWIFGDGATSTERNPVHTYAAPGDYDVILTVTDNLGAAKTKTHRAEPK
ncbi:MAG TPA: PKD domain-containing protein [Gemmatimonadales bacterium]|nr:PKD domain-containing protein [Gemmatimonadales bacterium]